MDGLSILAGLTAFNNRSTEAFKMILRDKTPLDDEWRRVATLLFSVVLGIVSVAGIVFSGGVSFDGTWLEPFSDNLITLSIVGGASVSMVSGIVQPIIERLQVPENSESVTISSSSDFKSTRTNETSLAA